MKTMQIAGYLIFLLAMGLINVPTVQAGSPTVRVGNWEDHIPCNLTSFNGAVTSVLKPVDIDTFTRDSLPQELGPGYVDAWMANPTATRIEQALKAQAIMIRSTAYHYSYNPQGNWRMCNTTGQNYNLRNTTVEGYQHGRGATQGNQNGTVRVSPVKRPNDIVTETMGQILVQNGRTFEAVFCDTSQNNKLVPTAQRGTTTITF